MKSAIPWLIEKGGWEDNLFFPELGVGLVTVPKAANTSLKFELLRLLPPSVQQFVEKKIEVAGDSQAIHGALRSTSYRCEKGRLLQPDVDLILTTTRNPIDRLTSFYFDKVLGDGWPIHLLNEMKFIYGFDKTSSFRDVAVTIANCPDQFSEIHFRSQTGIVGRDVLGDKRLRVIRTEAFFDDFTSICEEMNWALEPRGRMNKSNSSPLNLDSRLKNLIETRYRSDYESFYS